MRHKRYHEEVDKGNFYASEIDNKQISLNDKQLKDAQTVTFIFVWPMLRGRNEEVVKFLNLFKPHILRYGAVNSATSCRVGQAGEKLETSSKVALELAPRVLKIVRRIS